MLVEEFTKKIESQKWRLNNLYWIKNDEGERIPFKMNWAQEWLFEHLWFLNIILKARQLGITTFFCIFNLDCTIFEGLDVGLIAHTIDDAKKIFTTKVKYAWDNLPDVIKDRIDVDTETVRELKFKRDEVESSIYVGTSLRSGTVQRLHISELSTIDQKYPQKSIEIKSGALNTVHPGQIVTIESTAKGQVGVFYDFCDVAIKAQKSGKALTSMDYKMFFFAWFQHPQYRLEGDIVIPREMQEYFEELEPKIGIKLTQEQKNWYYKKSLEQKDEMKREFPSTVEEAFLASIEGSYFGKQMDRVLEQKRITKVPWEPTLPVHTFWDLGTSKQRKDSTSIIFVQNIGLEIRIIDFYGNTGEGFLHYKKVLDSKPYVYGKHWAPHDIEVTELGTGKSRFEVAAKIGINFSVVPNIGFLDGIEVARNTFNKCWFDEENTNQLVKALLAYRKKWDDNLGRFKDEPLKDWSSDPADAFRMMAVAQIDHRRLGEYDVEEEELARIKDKLEMQGKAIDPMNPFNI